MYLKDYALYNQWTNSRLSDLFAQCSTAQLQAPLVSSFPTIHETLLHLWAVEAIWLDRLNKVPEPRFLASGFTGSTTDILAGLGQTSQQLVDLVHQKEELFFQTPCEFTLLSAPGLNRMLPTDMLHHLFNHQTMHRGQLITMGRQVGITQFPRTDYAIWVRENKQPLG